MSYSLSTLSDEAAILVSTKWENINASNKHRCTGLGLSKPNRVGTDRLCLYWEMSVIFMQLCQKACEPKKLCLVFVCFKVWELKEATPPINFILKFSIVKLAQSYTKESKTCLLCQTEKVMIAFADADRDRFSILNLRSELTGKCRHRRKFLLMNWS